MQGLAQYSTAGGGHHPEQRRLLAGERGSLMSNGTSHRTPRLRGMAPEARVSKITASGDLQKDALRRLQAAKRQEAVGKPSLQNYLRSLCRYP